MHANTQQRDRTPFEPLADSLARIGREFNRRGWALGTSGNFSAVVSREPLILAITATGLDKADLAPDRILQVDERGAVVAGTGRPSSETGLHVATVRIRKADAVLHTHSVWGTIVSETCSAGGGVAIEGYEMLKGLEGVRTHEHREWLPIIDNSQDYGSLVVSVSDVLTRHPILHGFLLRGHGLYTWGQDLAEAKRHVEILEFLLEVTGRKLLAGPGAGP